jgi:hypothetical protein
MSRWSLDINISVRNPLKDYKVRLGDFEDNTRHQLGYRTGLAGRPATVGKFGRLTCHKSDAMKPARKTCDRGGGS